MRAYIQEKKERLIKKMLEAYNAFIEVRSQNTCYA